MSPNFKIYPKKINNIINYIFYILNKVIECNITTFNVVSFEVSFLY